MAQKRRLIRVNRRLCPCTLGGYNDLVPFTLTLDHNTAPEAEYRKDAQCSARHAGQLKLLCSEVYFLRQFSNPSESSCITVIYAGAAPGLHIPRLASMFPDIKLFVLIDPHKSALVDGGRFQIMQCLMTDSLAEELRVKHGPDILFISDVRVGPSNTNESDKEHQERIQMDMDRQLKWHQILDPIASMFKFRLPWNLNGKNYSFYPEGIIHLPVFGKRLTHETRLVVRRGAKIIQYDNKKYERQLAYFNRIVRNYALFDGLCYDCMAFRAICGNDAVEEIERELDCLGRVWSKQMSSSTYLFDPDYRYQCVCY